MALTTYTIAKENLEIDSQIKSGVRFNKCTLKNKLFAPWVPMESNSFFSAIEVTICFLGKNYTKKNWKINKWKIIHFFNKIEKKNPFFIENVKTKQTNKQTFFHKEKTTNIFKKAQKCFWKKIKKKNPKITRQKKTQKIKIKKIIIKQQQQNNFRKRKLKN
jgi:hypothetical protein